MKKALILIMVLIMVFGLVGCGVNSEELDGIWVSYNTDIDYAIVLEIEDGEFTQMGYEGGNYKDSWTGTYEIKGNNLFAKATDGNNLKNEFKIEKSGKNIQLILDNSVWKNFPFEKYD